MTTLNDLIAFDSLIQANDFASVNFRLNFEYQLQTTYGLSQNQTAEFASNWNTLWMEQNTFLLNNLTSTYKNESGLVYWQWANSTFSQMAIGQESWALGAGNAANMFPGFFEYPYFVSAGPFSGLQTSSPENWAAFENVTMFNDTNSFENLFLIYDPTKGENSDPPADSLFAIANMQTLVTLGMSTPNILVD